MTDQLPLYAIRQRLRDIHDKLRAIGLHIPLLCDSMYERGEFTRQQWIDMHLFRHDQAELRDAQVNGQVRGPRPKDARAGFRMPSFGIERALQCRNRMDGHCYDVAMILVGLKQGQVERLEAMNAAWQVAELYRGDGGRERWRD